MTLVGFNQYIGSVNQSVFRVYTLIDNLYVKCQGYENIDSMSKKNESDPFKLYGCLPSSNSVVFVK